jgi:hypothetical protein
MSHSNSPTYKNNILDSKERNKYISKIENSLGYLKEGVSTPLHHKIIEKYENINLNTRYISIFVVLFIIIFLLFKFIKPGFIINKKIKTNMNSTMNISTKKNQEQKEISYTKLTIYSFILSSVLFGILYFFKTKNKHIGILFGEERNI